MSTLNFVYTCKDLASDPFACPNCGHVFYVKWFKLYFTWGTALMYGKAKLKCPRCKQKDMCSRPHDD